MRISRVIGLSGLASLAFAAPWSPLLNDPSTSVPHTLSIDSTSSLSKRDVADTYNMYWGDGSVSAGWPTKNQWFASFDDMWNANLHNMAHSCRWGYSQADNSPQELEDVKRAILAVADEKGVDSRFVLAIVLQESQGCVRVASTYNGVYNPGLMQSHHGEGSCNRDGKIDNPCPYASIHLMIHDGVAGTSSGDGLFQLLQKTGFHSDADYYRAARMYNSGSVAESGNLHEGVATHCYAMDVANRLTGWTDSPAAPRLCHL